MLPNYSCYSDLRKVGCEPLLETRKCFLDSSFRIAQNSYFPYRNYIVNLLDPDFISVHSHVYCINQGVSAFRQLFEYCCYLDYIFDFSLLLRSPSGCLNAGCCSFFCKRSALLSESCFLVLVKRFRQILAQIQFDHPYHD